MEQKKISWKLLAFMAFSTVWGFGNVVNGFVWFDGIQVILAGFSCLPCTLCPMR